MITCCIINVLVLEPRDISCNYFLRTLVFIFPVNIFFIDITALVYLMFLLYVQFQMLLYPLDLIDLHLSTMIFRAFGSSLTT